MTIKLQKTVRYNLTAQGMVKDISEDGVLMEDSKSEKEFTFTYDEFENFLGEEIKLTIVNSSTQSLDEGE